MLRGAQHDLFLWQRLPGVEVQRCFAALSITYPVAVLSTVPDYPKRLANTNTAIPTTMRQMAKGTKPCLRTQFMNQATTA